MSAALPVWRVACATCDYAEQQESLECVVERGEGHVDRWGHVAHLLLVPQRGNECRVARLTPTARLKPRGAR